MKTNFKNTKLYSLLSRADNRMLRSIDTKPFLSCLGAGILMNALIYCLHAQSLIGGLGLIGAAPLYFLFNTLIVIAFYSLSLFFSRRIFVMSLVTVVWLALGVTNCVLLGMRNSPLEAIDFYIVRTGIAIVHVYLSTPQLVLILIGIAAALALLVALFIKCPKSRPDYVRNLLIVVCCLLALFLLTLAVVGLADADPQNFDNMKEAYNAYGFPYCFLRSVFERGIPQPENYSEEELRELVAELAATPSIKPERTPNVIMVQLESFFDIKRMPALSFSEDPIPNFTAMREQGSSGLVSVPAIGSGTANTEFEVLSGLDLEFFGTGEYPYASILSEHCCETIAYSLSALGYGTHSMHNHTGTFYDRYRVYANLGFDTFTPVEHMIGVEYNPLDWEKDSILTKYILKALSSTDTPDFVFAVSVQGHGKYPEVPMDIDPVVTLSGIAEEDRRNAFEYYINQLHEMDAFIGELRDAVAALEEDTVLVLYGDHLPALDIAADQMENGDLFGTDYVIWSNFDLPKTQVDLEAYQLSALLLDKLGIDNNLVGKVHRKYAGTGEYSSILRLVGYDMLYGDGFAFGETFPYTTKDMRLGLDRIVITNVHLSVGSEFFVGGQGFTPHSYVFINEKKAETVYLSDQVLFVEDYTPKIGDRITVAQVSVDLQKLSTTPPYIVTAADTLADLSLSD